MMHILILGGDGYLGWPTAMYFSKKGYAVTVVDNYFRRDISKESNIGILYPVPNLEERAALWHKKTGLEIKVVILDLNNIGNMESLFNGKVQYKWCVEKKFTGVPQTIVHYAEQPSAPFSIMSHKNANLTISNNLIVTNNVMFLVKKYDSEIHIIKLGTMGEYGTPNIDIEEGWLDVEHKGRKHKFLYPRQGSSIYHTSKIMDTDLLWFGVRTWGLRVTDLMQGPVYGLLTEEMEDDENLMSIFNYDEIFGTVINRFMTMAISGYPLTIYGKGGQTRGYLNIIDTLQCIFHAASNPASLGELRIFNQIVETLSVNEIAMIVKDCSKDLGYDVQINNIENPRVELEEHYYNPTYQGLRDLGVKPHPLTKDIMIKMLSIVEKFKKNIDKDLFYNGIKW